MSTFPQPTAQVAAVPARTPAIAPEELGVFVRKPDAPPIGGFIRVTVGSAAERAAFAGSFAEALAAGREKAAV
jgi:histidinol-phosphate/aromatic aminotransferase/cobyric acid decarboxylase-like protein